MNWWYVVLYLVAGILYNGTVAVWITVHFTRKYGTEPAHEAYEAVHNANISNGDLNVTNLPINLLLWPIDVTANMVDTYQRMEEYLIGNGYRPLN